MILVISFLSNIAWSLSHDTAIWVTTRTPISTLGGSPATRLNAPLDYSIWWMWIRINRPSNSKSGRRPAAIWRTDTSTPVEAVRKPLRSPPTQEIDRLFVCCSTLTRPNCLKSNHKKNVNFEELAPVLRTLKINGCVSPAVDTMDSFVFILALKELQTVTGSLNFSFVIHKDIVVTVGSSKSRKSLLERSRWVVAKSST